MGVAVRGHEEVMKAYGRAGKGRAWDMEGQGSREGKEM